MGRRRRIIDPAAVETASTELPEPTPEATAFMAAAEAATDEPEAEPDLTRKEIKAARRAGRQAAKERKKVAAGDRPKVWRRVREAVVAAEAALPGAKRGPERKAWVVAFLNTLIDFGGMDEEQEARLIGRTVDIVVFLYNLGIYVWPHLKAAA